MTIERKSLELALKALEGGWIQKANCILHQALAQPEQPDLDAICQDLQEKTYNQAMRIVALEAQLKQQEQESVAIADGTFNHNCPIGTPLYTTTPQRKPWVSLTDEQIDDAIDAWFGCEGKTWRVRMRAAIKAAHRIKE